MDVDMQQVQPTQTAQRARQEDSQSSHAMPSAHVVAGASGSLVGCDWLQRIGTPEVFTGVDAQWPARAFVMRGFLEVATAGAY